MLRCSALLLFCYVSCLLRSRHCKTLRCLLLTARRSRLCSAGVLLACRLASWRLCCVPFSLGRALPLRLTPPWRAFFCRLWLTTFATCRLHWLLSCKPSLTIIAFLICCGGSTLASLWKFALGWFMLMGCALRLFSALWL